MKKIVAVGFLSLLATFNSPAQSPLPSANTPVTRQTEYDPSSGESPLELLATPPNGAVYFSLKLQARQLFREKRFAEAEPLLDRLAVAYPRDPDNWRMLADTKAALKKPLAAVEANREAGKLLGWDLEYWAGYKLAENYLAAGNKRAALDALRWMIFERHGFLRSALYDDPDYSALRDDREFLDLIGRVDTKGWSREKGWMYDIDFLYNEVKRVNPDYRDKPFPVELDRRYKKLRGNVSKLSNEEIFVGMCRMLAPLHQGHVALLGVPNNRYLPLHLYAFPEGIFVIDASDEFKNLIGSRVISIGDLKVDEALRRVAEAMSVDGDMEYLWVGPALLGSAYHLKGIGAIKTLTLVNIEIQQPNGTTKNVALPTMTDQLAPRMDKLVAPSKVPAPLFLSKIGRQVQTLHWEIPMPEHDALYVQVNNILDDKSETLAQFGERLWTVIEDRRPRNVILDLRHNNGGTTQKYPELLRTLIAFTRQPGNQLYVAIGRRTFSATANFVTDLERLTNPIFIGEASSECCNLYGDPVFVRLAYSGIQGELTAVKWQLSTPGDRRREMSPQVPVQLTASAYFKGDDPALETIYQLISKRQEAGDVRKDKEE
jgi:hypothetical protein